MSDMNLCIFQGNLTRDPEHRTVSTANGDVSVVTFTIAVNARGKNGKASFPRCEAWAEGADLIMKYFTKGKPIRVIAEHVTENFENKDGERVFRDKFRVKEFNFVNSGRPQGEAGESGGEEGEEEETKKPAPKAEPKKPTAAPAKGGNAKTSNRRKAEDDDGDIPF
jgi:single stranded DNA-binding protein